MTRTRLRTPVSVALLWLLAVVAPSATAAAADPPVPVREYIARLDALASEVGAAPDTAPRATVLVNQLPDVLRVDGSPRIFEIPTASIRRDLRAWRTERDAAARQRLVSHLRTLRSEAARFEEPAATSPAPRALLTGILNGKEFRDIHGPTWVDRLRQRAVSLLVSLMGRLFLRSAIPTINSILVYALMAVAVVALALTAYRLILRSAAAETMPPSRPAAPPKDWPLWLADAEAAAARGSWRDAIHFTYWCAVAFLEARGAWRPDRARTPREYLQLLPPSSDDGAMLRALTRRFELVWYGHGDADARAFAESIANLKKMGCPAA
jgi:hypothetical protein